MNHPIRGIDLDGHSDLDVLEVGILYATGLLATFTEVTKCASTLNMRVSTAPSSPGLSLWLPGPRGWCVRPLCPAGLVIRGVFVCVVAPIAHVLVGLSAIHLEMVCVMRPIVLGVLMLEVLGLAVGMAGTLVCFPTLCSKWGKECHASPEMDFA